MHTVYGTSPSNLIWMLSVVAMLALQAPALDFQVESTKGLTVTFQGVPVIRGSWFQYHEPDWSKGYYSSSGQHQKIEKLDANTVKLTFTGGDGLVSGTQIYQRTGNKLTVDSSFDWNGGKSVQLEVASGLIWAPAWEQGKLTADGQPTRALDSFVYTNSSSTARRFSEPSSLYQLEAPMGRLTVRSSQPMTLFDARGGYPQPFAEGTQLWWHGVQGLNISKGQTQTLRVEYEFETKPSAAPRSESVNLPLKPLKDAFLPNEERLPLIPKPKTNQLDFNKTLDLTGRYSFPAGKFRFFDLYTAAVARRFQPPTTGSATKAVPMDAGVSRLGLAHGGYRITIKPSGISVYGEEEEGLRNGLERLARLVFLKDGKLMLPTGTLLDYPSNPWRGAHLFVGPSAVQFHRKLWERVMLPLGFNKVVLQCERTNWQAIPGTATEITMPREDLAQLFQMYRNRGVEPVPLIQSFGHMEWLFANGKNRDIAFNPEVLYSVDPRKPRTREILRAIWKEAIGLLNPKIVHFGLDEVDMRGFPDDPELVTELWQMQLSFLSEIARENKVEMMLWGDKALAPGEAIDAAHGNSKKEAAERRAAIPKGAYIADWHYRADPEPQKFVPSLQLWKREGFRPIASAWYRPENIRGFALAADIEKVGFLQTTWAGYESSEANMLKHLEQFSAMILAGDYTWSGRSEPVGQLGYDPMTVFRKMYFDPPSPLKASGGQSLGGGATLTIGRTRFAKLPPIALRSIIDDNLKTGPTSVTLPVTGSASEIALAADTLTAANQGDPISVVRVTYSDGTSTDHRLNYGDHVRAATDPKSSPFVERASGLTAIRLSSDPRKNLREIRLIASSPYSGLRVHGLTLRSGS